MITAEFCELMTAPCGLALGLARPACGYKCVSVLGDGHCHGSNPWQSHASNQFSYGWLSSCTLCAQEIDEMIR